MSTMVWDMEPQEDNAFGLSKTDNRSDRLHARQLDTIEEGLGGFYGPEMALANVPRPVALHKNRGSTIPTKTCPGRRSGKIRCG